jgi:hypothetical protein
MVFKKKGQLLMTDFMLSIAIFLAILLSTMALWSSVDTQIRDAEGRRDMQAITVYISDTLVRSTGYPANWTNDTVQMIGLASDEHVIDVEKVFKLKRMDYDQVREMMKLGNYELHAWFTDGAGYNLTSGVVRSPVAVIARTKAGTDYAKMLNNSQVVWDLYWDNNAGAGGIDFDYVKLFTKRNNYADKGAIKIFRQLMNNQTSYRTIIIEDIGLAYSDLAPDDKNNLTKFVKNGGILIYTDTAMAAPPAKQPLVSLFNMSFIADSSTDAYVLVPKPLMYNSSAGDRISFTTKVRRTYSNSTTNDNVLHAVANSTPDTCQICWWDYGFGRVYYLEDTSGSYNGTINDLVNHLNIVGEPLSFGHMGANSTDLINVRRMAMLSGFEREVVNLNLIVWR